ncbi:50S ribosomal protein L25 [Candidatus Dojkabacteria bacterium]|uniref:Large ribosomal subunit protein bL25 n=1 Tax=Candidatus Dojkabacteria bacterium TaxID=2099670 RepID=A0A955KYU4_9BACT|nr:50S ribosomal protein L25 [Candidatus Dojkabacteria bacterium]
MAAKLNVQPREISGKQVKQVRKQGMVPAALYGPKYESANFAVDEKEFRKIFQNAGYSQLIDADVNGETEKLLVKEVQIHPVTDEILHASLYVVDKNTPITAEVPVELVGLAPAQDLGVGFVVPALDNITIHCLPSKLISKIEVDITGLAEVGQSISISDLTLPEGVELDSSMDETTSVAYVAGDQKIIEEEEVAPEGEEGEEGAEGEAGAEGEEKAEGEKAEE